MFDHLSFCKNCSYHYFLGAEISSLVIVPGDMEASASSCVPLGPSSCIEGKRLHSVPGSVFCLSGSWSLPGGTRLAMWPVARCFGVLWHFHCSVELVLDGRQELGLASESPPCKLTFLRVGCWGGAVGRARKVGFGSSVRDAYCGWL